ncbi:MAG TPA: heparan-alpha-glucosaminide N-acetyltransferase domain-containing protein [Terriglobia bacterium]|nr:heparan-alpha-glucosaminide N-acetyltransferase domain-containing protein [Terriglobia bacterium]
MSASSEPARNALPILPAVTGGRLASLDLFRGATIAAMILVNIPGNEDAAYWPLKHAEWNGWTPTDLIFPFFLFIVGVSLVFSFASRLKRGDSRTALLLHTFRRSAIIAAIGLGLNALFAMDFRMLRIPGVLQRIALCYLVAAILFLCLGRQGRAMVAGALLLGYWILMCFVPVPGFGLPGRDVPLLHPDWNLAAYLDRKLVIGQLYEGTRDPEGLLSTLPAIATTLLGVFTGEWLRSKNSPQKKAAWMLISGLAGLALGCVWGVWFPINKKLWTSSYVLFTGGFALVCLAVCYWANDIRNWRGAWTKPFVIFGANAIAAYMIHIILAVCIYSFHAQLDGRTLNGQDYLFQRFFAPLTGPSFASLLYSVAFVLVCFLPIWLMYRKRIFLKV